MLATVVCPVHVEEIHAPLTTEQTEMPYQGRLYKVTAFFYKCPLCGTEFTTNESDTETLKQIPDYFEKHHGKI